MYRINEEKLKDLIKARGYENIKAFAHKIGIHRNSIHQYLSGKSVFPKNLDLIMDRLGISPFEIIEKVEQNDVHSVLPVSPYVDEMSLKFPEVTFILFGSRAKLTNHKYSDWDIGVYSLKGIDHETFIKMKIASRDLEDRTPFMIDLVNINSAPEHFLKESSKSWCFLAGRRYDFEILNKELKS